MLLLAASFTAVLYGLNIMDDGRFFFYTQLSSSAKWTKTYVYVSPTERFETK